MFLNREWERQLAIPGSTANHEGNSLDFLQRSVLSSRVPFVPQQPSKADSGGCLLNNIEYFYTQCLPAWTYHAMAAGKVAFDMNANALCFARTTVAKKRSQSDCHITRFL